jgi:signal peptidase II
MRRWILLFAIVITVLAVDQISKRIVADSLELYESVQPIPALSAVFQITYSENTGAAFGFLEQAGDVFLVVAVVVIVAMLFFYPRIPDESTMTRFAIGLIIGGALGNAIDRITSGAVVDFIHYQIPGVISNVSNLADHAIVFGVLIIFVDSWRSDRRKQCEEAAAQTAQAESAESNDQETADVPALERESSGESSP